MKLHAASVNRIDLDLCREPAKRKTSIPYILGSDGAGTIVECGRAVSALRIGDPVCLYPVISCVRCDACTAGHEPHCAQAKLLSERGGGTFAEFVRVPARNCFPIPQGFSPEQAAAFPLTYLTAWRMLMTQVKLKPGEAVLIAGIGGGVASAALRIAAQLGATIIATSRSAEKLERASKFVKVQSIHTPEGQFAKAVRDLTAKRGVDVVVDCIGGSYWTESLASLARGGRLVSCGAVAGAHPQTNLQRIFWNHLSVLGSSAGSRAEFRQLLDFLAATNTKPIIDRTFALAQAADALRWLEDSRQFGKIVLRVGE